RVAEHGERQLVLICGEPGIGKTRLAAEAARAAHADGANVLFGQHDPEASGPHQGFGEALVTFRDSSGEITEIETSASATSLPIRNLRCGESYTVTVVAE